MAPFSLLALCGHEQPDCQEGRFPSGTGMNARLRRPFFSPAFSVYDLSEITVSVKPMPSVTPAPCRLN
ncbi:hypothetical protein [Escherichia coli]|uniref:hypothetical protein n=1 Tax=Escherichia coli TaxID=562 RepID=UPI0009072A54|nr:hypothetical protein [Escherichia coli]